MSDFYDRLYMGLGYEYHAAGHFWRLNHEAFKIDADFGFDLLVYNQGERTHKEVKESHPYLVQVKAANVYKWEELDRRAGSRSVSRVQFKLNRQHYNNLIKEKNSYLICYFVDREKSGKEDKIISYFWLSNKHLKYLHEGKNKNDSNNPWKWFRECSYDKDKIYLEACVHVQANLTKNYKEKIEKVKQLDENLATDLEKLIKKSDIKNKNSSDYITLCAETSEGEIDTDSHSLKPELMKLSCFNDEVIVNQIPFR